jgi:phenylacetate-CoA ligase
VYLQNWDHMSEDEARTRQGAVLHRFLKDQVLKYSPFYRELFKEKGLSADDIRTFDDLQKIPFTTKADIAPTAENPSKPRMLVLQPDRDTYASTIGVGKKIELFRNQLLNGRDIKGQVLDEYLPSFFIATTGRTANPTPFLYSRRDLSYFRAVAKRLFEIGGISRERDFVFSAFPYAPHLAFWIVYQGGVESGTPMFHSGGGKIFGTDRIIPAVERFGATILVGIPGYIYHVLRLAAERKSDFSKVRMIVLGAERVTENLKQHLKDFLESMGSKDPTIISTFGFTEGRAAWIECPVKDSIGQSTGYHLYPDIEIFEIVDPVTGKPVGDGMPGEVVYSALDWRGSVVLRYRTGDYANSGITWKRCPACARSVPRLGTDLKRMTDQGELKLSKIRGTLVDFNEFFTILSGMPGIIEWQVEITKHDDDPHELDEIHIHVAVQDNIDKENFSEAIKHRVRESLECNVEKVHFHTPAEMAILLGIDDRPKELRIHDRRLELEKMGGSP